MMDEVKEGIRYAFQTRNELTLAVSTSGHGGMEAVFCNLVEDGDVVLVAVNGIWGERAADMASRYGATVVRIEADAGNGFGEGDFEEALGRHRPALLFVTQGESSTGVYQDVEGLGHVCHRLVGSFANAKIVWQLTNEASFYVHTLGFFPGTIASWQWTR